MALGTGGQVAADAVGFPQREVAVKQYRHLPVGIDSAEACIEVRLNARPKR